MLLHELTGLLEGKFKKETAAEIFARYESLKKSNANPELLAKVLAQANDAMTSEMNSKMRDMNAKYSGEDWWETVKTFYKIEERNHEWAIISDAKDWKETKEWVYPTKYEADEQLLKLIGYKIADRKKGTGSEDKDFARADMLKKRREAEMAEGFEPGDVVKVHQQVKGTDSGLYGKFNIEKITPTIITAYDHKTKETMKFNAKTLRGIGAYDHLMIVEGSWAMPNTPKDEAALKALLSKRLSAKNASKALYNLVGDDSLFDAIGEIAKTDPEDDVRNVVKQWLKKNIPSLFKAINESVDDEHFDYPIELAGRLPKNLETREEILAAGKKRAEKDVGRNTAIYYFEYDETFPDRLVDAYLKASPLGELSVKESLGLSPYDLGHTHGRKNTDPLMRKPKWAKGTKEYAEYEKGVKDGTAVLKSLHRQYGTPVDDDFVKESDDHAARALYLKTYKENGGGGRVPNKAASEAAYAVVEKECGKKAVDALKKYHGVHSDVAAKAGSVYKESLMSEMLKMVPRGYLTESFNETDTVFLTPSSQGSRYKLFDEGTTAEHKRAIKHHESELKHLSSLKPGVDMPKGTLNSKIAYETMRAKLHKDWLAKPVKESANPNFTYKGYDTSQEPDGVMVLVLGDDGDDEDYDEDYYGVNVVFGKPGTEPELVSDDKRSNWQAKHDRKKIIVAAEKRLDASDKKHLASLK